jgi:hypothetical protein
MTASRVNQIARDAVSNLAAPTSTLEFHPHAPRDLGVPLEYA